MFRSLRFEKKRLFNLSFEYMDSEALLFENLAQNVKSSKKYHLLKRFFDIIFSLGVMLLFSPFFVGIAIFIRLSSKGKAIYVQPRLGRGGRPFNCFKFRTMHLDADDKLLEILKSNSDLEAEWKKNQKLKIDPRTFPFGRWLRRTSLDELPQFWNVLKGDLSVVGPRPYMISQREEIGPLASKILSVRPGITGLWQTSGRSRTTFRERVALDAKYLDKYSFAFDLILIFKTIPQLLFSKDAY